MAIGQLQNKNPKYYTASIVFLVFVAIITVIIFAYKTIVHSQNESALGDIREHKMTIAKMRQDKDIQAYELYDANRERLNTLGYLSNIPLFHASIQRIARDYNIGFTGFSYAKGNISVAALAGSDSSDEAYEKLESLIADFREKEDIKNPEEKKEFLFDLEFVRSFLGSNNITTALSFIVKPEKKEKEESETKETIEAAIKNNK